MNSRLRALQASAAFPAKTPDQPRSSKAFTEFRPRLPRWSGCPSSNRRPTFRLSILSRTSRSGRWPKQQNCNKIFYSSKYFFDETSDKYCKNVPVDDNAKNDGNQKWVYLCTPENTTKEGKYHCTAALMLEYLFGFDVASKADANSA